MRQSSSPQLGSCVVAEDRDTVRSPLVGIHAGLTASRTDLAFATACDMPHVEPALVEFLLCQAEGVDAVVHGYCEPLCAAYRKTCIGSIERLIEDGTLKVSELYPLIDIHEAREEQIRRHDPELRSLVNLNEAKSPCHEAAPSAEHA